MSRTTLPGLWSVFRIGGGVELARVRAVNKLVARKVAGKQLGVLARELDALLVEPTVKLIPNHPLPHSRPQTPATGLPSPPQADRSPDPTPPRISPPQA